MPAFTAVRIVASAACLAAVAGVAHAGPACATDKAEVKAALTRRYAELKAMMNARDQAGVLAILTPDFVMEEASGTTQDGATMMAALMRIPPDPNKVSTTSIDALTLNGATATVSQRYHLTTSKPTADGRPRAIEINAASTDTWVCSGGVWLQRRTRTDEIALTVNGQTVNHQVRAKP